MKNLTPFQLALLNSSIISLIVGILYLLVLVPVQIHPWYIVLIIVSITWLISYIVFGYTLEFFIYRKIKLIYKSIHNLKFKGDKNKFKIELKEDIISEINEEVAEWAKSKNIELTQLKNVETFRREFLANVSHELKTPIFNIQGFVHSLLDGGLNDPSVNQKYLVKAAKNLDNLSEIVNDLEIISRLETGDIPLELKTFDIHLLCQEVFESLEFLKKRHHINMSFKEGSNKSFYVLADLDKIKTVLIWCTAMNESLK